MSDEIKKDGVINKSEGMPGKTLFNNKQLDIFQSLLGNTSQELDSQANTIDLWDSIPRYSVSRKAQSVMRDAKGRLDLLEIPFHYRKTNLNITIQPALIKEVVKGVEQTVSYYPSAPEELIEDALRKICLKQNLGFHEPQKRSGVVFTLYQLRQELKQRGHTRSFYEIVKSLDILAASVIFIEGGDAINNYSRKSTYFRNTSSVTRKDLENDPNARWVVDFHPLVTDSIDSLTYRSFGYDTHMSFKTQLGRWIHKYLVNRYTFAKVTKPFEMKYSTIKRDSFMLENYKNSRQAILACDASMDELKDQKIALLVKRKVERGARDKIIDVLYTITPTPEFIAEVKRASARLEQAKKIVVIK